MAVLLVWLAAAALALAFGRWVLAPADARPTPAAEPACAAPAPPTPPRTVAQIGAQTGGVVLALAIALECSLGVAAAAGAGPATLASAAAERAQDLWCFTDEQLSPAPAEAFGESLAAPAWTPSAAFSDGWLL